jgi:DNA adenine methylase
MPSLLKTPLRYLGGKAKAINFLSRFIPEFQDYREPFVGGGSMALYVRQQFPKASCWINDLNHDVYCF